MRGGHNKYKSIKADIGKVEGAIDDIRKLQSFASNLINHRAGSSSVLLKLTYESMTRLAGLLPLPYMSHYLKFYQPGIDLLSDLWRAKDEAKLAQDWSRGLHKSATEFEKAINDLVREFSYAGAMVDLDGVPSDHLPAGLKRYLKLVDDYEYSTQVVRNSIRNVDWNKPMRAMDTVSFHGEYALGQAKELQRNKQSLSRGIVYQARDISAAHAHFASTFSKIESAGKRASKTMHRLTSSSNPVEKIAGLSAQKAMNWDLYDREVKTHASGIDNEDIDKFVNGNWKSMRDYKRMKHAMQKMKLLSQNWSRWATYAARGNFMQWY